jgi:hypothetical protein
MSSKRNSAAAAIETVWTNDSPAIICPRDFRVIDGGEQYRLELRGVPISFELRQIRYDSGDLLGRLTVRTTLSGARTLGDVLNVSTLNLSSAQARSARAKLLEELSRAPQIDWHRLIEELATRVFDHQDQGDPATDLATISTSDFDDDTFTYHGLTLPARHQSFLFGDGGVMKSFLALALAVHLSRSGFRVGFFDWELFAQDHARRLRMMCADSALPSVFHVRCVRPLVYECERLRRFARQE